MVGNGENSFLLHARGIEHHSHGVQNCLGAINIVLASGRIGREGCGYATITGQANGQGGREHGQKCDQLPGARDISNPEHRAYVAGVWGIESGGNAASRRRCLRDVSQDRSRRDTRPVEHLLQSEGLAARQQLHHALLEKLEFYVAIDFFLNETARHADIVLPGSLQEEDEGVVTQIEGRVIKINKAVDPPGEARQDWRIIQDIAKALGRERGFTFTSRARFSTSCASPRRAASPITPASPTKRSRSSTASSGPVPAMIIPARRACSTRLVESRSPKAAGRSTFPMARRASTSRRTRRLPKTSTPSIRLMLTTGRVVSQFLSGTQTRRIGPLVDQYPEPRIEMHPQLAQAPRHRRWRLDDGRIAPRRDDAAARWS